MLSDAQWKDLFKAQKDQGVSVKSFCRKNQINYAAWYKARKRLLERNFAAVSCSQPSNASFSLKLEQHGKKLEVNGPLELLPAISGMLGSLS